RLPDPGAVLAGRTLGTAWARGGAGRADRVRRARRRRGACRGGGSAGRKRRGHLRAAVARRSDESRVDTVSCARYAASAVQGRADGTAGMIDCSAYTLEPLHADGELVLYRGRRAIAANDNRAQVLVLAPSRDHASPRTRALLEHEAALAAELDPRWAV